MSLKNVSFFHSFDVDTNAIAQKERKNGVSTPRERQLLCQVLQDLLQQGMQNPDLLLIEHNVDTQILYKAAVKEEM